MLNEKIVAKGTNGNYSKFALHDQIFGLASPLLVPKPLAHCNSVIILNMDRLDLFHFDYNTVSKLVFLLKLTGFDT